MTCLLWLMIANGPEDPLSSINTPIMQYVEVLMALAGVLLLAYATLRFGLPRFFGIQASGKGLIQVLARHALEPRKTLYLVKTGSQVFLIGTSEKQVEYLTAIAPENATELLEATRREEPSPKNFRQILGLLGREGR
jgi:flagellar biogenesis protein FliO